MDGDNAVQAVPEGAIMSQDLCPNLWALVEDSAAQGYIDPSAFRKHVQICQRCQADGLRLVRTAAEKADLGFAGKMFFDVMIEKIQQAISQPTEGRVDQ